MQEILLRNYEVSIWTLQDSFITILKHSTLENKGQLQYCKMNLKDDGTQELSFSLPMYIYDGNQRIENPIWFNTRNGTLIANMRKVKVIFNKKTEVEEVFEFIITKVTEKHENAELTCEVQCEGLAFHELGKIGYKIELNQDNYIEEWGKWASTVYSDEKEYYAQEPKNNINYWCDIIFNNSSWHYSVQMDWTAYDGLVIVQFLNSTSSRVLWALVDHALVEEPNLSLWPSMIENGLWEIDETGTAIAQVGDENEVIYVGLKEYASLTEEQKIGINKVREKLNLRRYDTIYEEPYVSSWEIKEQNQLLTPAYTEELHEKLRLLDETESNIYNLTQTIAETFGVFCKYKYYYDDTYHIIDREVIFYNNFIQESSGNIDITYPYNSTEISRELDGTDTITKMFVKSLTDEVSETGWATIMDTPANKSGEDYILNFDYLHEIGTISEEQYAEIPNYEALMHSLNSQIKPLENQLIAYQNEYTDVSAAETFAKNAVALDTERVSATNDLLNSLTDNTGILSITAARPEIYYIIPDSANEGLYCINIRQQGIIEDSIHIYKKYNISSLTFDKEIKNFTTEKIENNLTGKITNLTPFDTDVDNGIVANKVYVIYNYSPKLYYEEIKKTWLNRLKKDQKEYDKQHARAIELDGEKDTDGNRISDGLIQSVQKELDTLFNQKEEAIKKFERMMGPALREGTWQPEDDYANYGDKHSVNLTLDNKTNINNEVFISLGWDNELFDNELKNYYIIGADEKKVYYPCINLTNYLNRFTEKNLNANVERDNIIINSLSFIFEDSNIQENNKRYFAIGSQSQFAFLQNKETGIVIPVLMLTGAKDTLIDIDINKNVKNEFIGFVEINEANITTTPLIDTSEIEWINTDELENYEIVYPRIQISSGNLKISENELSVLRNNSLISNYTDYYILSRDSKDINNQYQLREYITIRPETIVRSGQLKGTYKCNYTISNTSLLIYLDAIQVLKENAYPKVSYTVKPALTNKSFSYIAYKTLNKITHINDYELKFKYVQGYISELNLDLDQPWEDDIVINNYKTKFEDLFTTIVAQTEQMKKNSYVVGIASQAFNPNGEINTDVLQDSIGNIEYSFNNGLLSITENNGILAQNDDGVVALRKDGIFTATEKDSNGDWKWNTGIIPSGINASLIKTGQLDTNLIRIYAGKDLKFQMNAEGIFAYKAWSQEKTSGLSDSDKNIIANHFSENDLNLKQYVVHNAEGLFLRAERGSPVIQNNQLKTLNKTIDRVEVSWDGFILRNWKDDKVFFADPDTGNLTVKGNIQATSLTIVSGSDENGISIDSYINQNSSTTYSFPAISGENLPDTGIENINFINGDLWINTSDNNKMYRYNGQAWILVSDTRILSLQNNYNSLNNNYTTLQQGYNTLQQNYNSLNTSKNRTYLSNGVPPTDNDYHEGDLLIDTSNKNKLYRYNGSTWDSAQDTGLTDFNLTSNASIISVESKGYNFNNHSPSIKLSPDTGLLIKGQKTENENSYPFFQVTSTGMGFFRYGQEIVEGQTQDKIDNLLYYKDGDLILVGEVQASSGKIGPWNIGGNAIYTGNADSFDNVNDNGIYLGKSGLRLGQAIEMQIDPDNNSFKEFTIYDTDNKLPNSDSEETENDSEKIKYDYFFKIKREIPEGETAYQTKFNLKNVAFEDDFIQSIVASVPSDIYKTTSSTDNSFPSTATNGSLGVLYSDVQQSGQTVTVFNANNIPYISGTAFYPGEPSETNGRNARVFGLRLNRWNVNGTKNAPPEDGLKNYCRAGVAETPDNVSGTVSCVQANADLTAGANFTLQFQYKTYNGSNYDLISENSTRSQGIIIQIYKNSPSQPEQPEQPDKVATTLIASGTFQVPFTDIKKDDNSTWAAEISLQAKAAIEKDAYYSVILYSKVQHSLIFVDVTSVRIGDSQGSSATQNPPYGLYLKTQNKWVLLSGGNGAPSTIENTNQVENNGTTENDRN